MKNFNLTTRKSLRLAASASLAVVAMVSSAHSQQTIQVSETVTLRTGNDASGQNPLNVGSSDGSIRILDMGSLNSWGSLDPADFFLARVGPFAEVITPNTGWDPLSQFSDPNARWIHSNHNPTGSNGTGSPDVSVLYAHEFDLPVEMPADAMVTLNIEHLADDYLRALYLHGSSFLYPVQIMGGPVGGYTTPTQTVIGPVTASSIGLSGGQNTLFFHQETISTSHVAGIKYAIDVTVEYCVLEVELRSGEGFAIGSDDTNVRVEVLNDGYGATELGNAFSVLSANGGNSPKVVSPISNWTMLSDPDSQWINSHITASGTGHPDTCGLYAHDFQLPAGLDPFASVTLDVEWAADDRLIDVYVNQVPLGITSSTSGHYNFPHLDSVSGLTVSSLSLGAGLNSLYFEQTDISHQYSGVIYSAKLRIVVPCEGVQFDTFCDCVSDWSPCGNSGQPGQGCANSTGVGSRLTASGTSSNITLHADNLPLPQTIGLFFSGSNSIGPLHFGDGLRCVGPAIRLGVVITNTGQADYGPVASGTNYQFWYRDNTGPCLTGFNLSSAISIP